MMISSFVFEVLSARLLMENRSDSLQTVYQSNHSFVICKLYDCICAVGWYTVVCIEGVEKRAQHAALWSSSAECQGRGVMGPQPDSLWWFVKKSLIHLHVC